MVSPTRVACKTDVADCWHLFEEIGRLFGVWASSVPTRLALVLVHGGRRTDARCRVDLRLCTARP